MIKVLRKFLSALQNRKAGGAAYSRRLELLGLEQRINPVTITVSSNADSGAGSLRQAIIDANTTAGDDIINFSITGTITLDSFSNTVNASLPTIVSASTPITGGGTAGTLTINGPGSSSLTISGLDGGNTNRNFNIFNIAAGGNLSISGVTVSGAQITGNGGGFANAGTLTISNSTISGNSATGNGGGIDNRGSLTVSNSTLSGNTANDSGGGIFNQGNFLTVTNSTVSDNTANGSGGGIFNQGNFLTVTNSTVSDNTANGSGGGIRNTFGRTATVSNSSLSGNTANTSNGGGISNAGTLNVSNSTLSDNTSGLGGVGGGGGGGIFNFDTLNIANTIIANTINGGDYAASGGTIVTNTNNLVEDGSITNASSTSPGSGNISGDPRLGPLQNNGGPTFTMALGFGSPAISAGNSTVSNATPIFGLDQRGINRTTSDIGAYSFGIQVTTTAASGIGSLDAAITLANTTPGNDQISFNLTGSSPYTITLAGALPTIIGGAAGTLTITGLGATSLTISGNNGIGDRNFNIFNIAAGGNLSISGVTVSGAQKTSGNGGAFNNAGALSVTNSILSGNSAINSAIRGGGINNNSGATLSVTNSILSGNSALRGGGIYNYGTLTVTNSTISGNFTNRPTGGGGGGIANSSSGIVTVTNSTLSGNTAYRGGGINNYGNLTVTNSTLSGNVVFISSGLSDGNRGGGINNIGSLTVTNSTLSGNFVYRFGGAIYNRSSGTVTVTNSTLSGNRANSSGGGIDNVGTLTVTNSTLSGNSADGSGGGINNSSSLPVTVTNSTLSGNSAGNNGGGIQNSGTLTVTNSTLSGNFISSSFGGTGGGINNSGTLAVTNTIIANSIRGGDFAGTAPSTNTNNLVSDGNISGSPYSWTVTGDPLLGPLQNNGGPTFTMALGFGSPAISATPLTPSNLDQRGFKRTNNDIGSTAYLAPAAINDIVISVNPIGQVGLFLSSAGTAITDFHTAFAGNILTITATTTGDITGSGTGITIHNTAKTISVDLTLLSVFSEIRIEGNSGNDSLTIGAGGVDLSIVTGGGADQSLIITTGAGNDTLNINNAIKAKGTGAVLITSGGTGTDQINLGASVITTGGNITFSNAVFLAANVTLSAGSGAINITGNIDSAASTNHSLTINATGDVTLGGTIGNTQALGTLLITGNDISLGNIGGASAGSSVNVSVQASDLSTDTASITLTGTTYKTNGQQFYNSSAIASSNDGTRPIILSGGPTVSLSSGNGFEAYGDWQLGGRVLSVDTTLLSATGGIIDFNNAKPASQQVFEGPGSLIVNAGTSGNVNINGAIGISNTPLTALTITNAKNAFFSGALFLDALTITDVTDSATDTGLVQFIGNLTVNNSMTVSAGGSYDVRMIGATNTIAAQTTFGNSGSLTLGDVGGDTFNFTGGIIATNPLAINLVGTITAAGGGVITLGDLNVKSGSGAVGGTSTGTITLGNAVIENGATLTVGTGIANIINIAAVTGAAATPSSNLTINTTGAVTVTGAVGTDIGNLTITNSGGTTFQSTVAAATATITNTTGTVAFQGNLNLTTSLLTAARGYNISIIGNSNSIASATAFLNTGLVTLGDGSGDTFAFDGGLTFTGNAASNIGAAITSSGDVINFGSGGVTLTQNSTVDTKHGLSTGADIIFGGTLNGTSAGAQTLGLTAGLGNITFTGVVGATPLGAVTVTSGATVLASSTFTAAGFLQFAGSGATTFTDLIDLTNQFDFTGTILNINGTGTNSVGTTMEVSNSGLFTTAIGANLTVENAFFQYGAGLNSIGGNIASTNNSISFLGGVTLTNSVLMSTGAGSGDDIVFSGTLDGTQTLGLTAGLGNITFTGAVGAGTRLGAVTVTSGATVLASSTFTAASFLQSAGSVLTTFTDLVDLAGMFDFTGQALNINGTAGTNLVGTTMDVTNAGLFTTANGVNLSVGTEFVQDGAGLNSIGGNIASTNDGISFLGGVTLTNDVTITTGAGTFDDINFRAGITGSFNLGLNAGTGGAITGTSVAINNLTITNGVSAAFTGAVTVNDLITATTATTISMTGTGNTFVQNVEFLNTGTVTLNNGSGDTTTFTGGLIVTAPSSITIKGTVAATNTDMILNTGVILADNTTLNAGTGNINLNGVVSGAFELTPTTSAPGITTISGANTNTTTNVTTGVVQINNSTPQTTNFVVSGGTLKGTGAILTLTATGTGIIAPGNSPGKITTTNLSLSSTNTLQIEITGANASPVAGTDYDQIVVSSGGTVDLNSAILNLSTTYTGNVGTVFTIIKQLLSAPIQGTFAGLAEGAFIQANGRAYQISYSGGTGSNDVTLTVYDPATVTSFSPTIGKTGTSVVITGSNFTNVSQVSFNGTVQPTYTENSPTQITTTVPSGATTGTISITTIAGTATSTSSFTVDNTAPTLSISANPGSLKANETSTITFTFSEVVTGFSSSIITVTNGTITNPVASSSTVYTAIFTPTLGIKADGTIAVSNNYFDLVGNQGTASSLTPPIAINTVQTPLVTGGASTTQGGASVVSLIDPDTGAIIGSAVPFPGFTGEIRVVSGDFNGDGKVDIIAAAGPGGGPAVSILDSETGEVMESFFAFDPAFTGGVFIAVRDFNGDGILDIIAGAGAGGGPEVRIFNGDGLTVIRSFFAYAEDFTGGVSVASVDFNSDGILDLVTGAGQGGAPHVKVFDGATNAIISQWYAYPISFTGGVFVAAGDIGNDGNIEVVTGAGSGGTPVVAVWDPYTGALLAQFMAYAEDFTGGVRVGVSDGNFDGILDLITGAGPGGGPEVKGFSFPTLDLLFSFFSGDPSNTSGVFVS